ncbi:MAG: hypothetical protein AAF674_16910 [Pseudomonadota bacterium]
MSENTKGTRPKPRFPQLTDDDIFAEALRRGIIRQFSAAKTVSHTKMTEAGQDILEGVVRGELLTNIVADVGMSCAVQFRKLPAPVTSDTTTFAMDVFMAAREWKDD